ncbi:hypothetical protein [Leucobacter insecticola]|uniref:hypothetical protein n=1 Tax=Leucobacter insecticola TaxID=2714934 RepID=UPI001FCA6AF7|nr:hypothetical protein [Leucobacter insecticola]
MSTPTTQISMHSRVRMSPKAPRNWSVVVSAIFLALVAIVAAISPFLRDAATAQSILDSLLPPGSPGTSSAPTNSVATCSC